MLDCQPQLGSRTTDSDERLIFHACGALGPMRYACEEDRGDLVAYLREHYGAVGPQVWRRPPYPSSLAHSDMDNAWRTATTRRTGGP